MTTNLRGERLDLWRGERHVLAGLDLAAGAGELLLVTGANGSGKTTLLRTLCGLMHLEEGRILWQGRNVREDLAAYHAQLVYLGHAPPLKGDLTAHENLKFWVGIRRDVSREEILAALERVGGAGWSERPVRTLSAGQRRRVALAGVSLFAAPLWLLDEPTTNLDGDGQRLVGTLVDERLRSGGIVIAAVHQDLPVSCADIRRVELVCR
jgi:heme exporter protein A